MAFTTNAGNPTTLQGTNEIDVLSPVDLAGNFIVRADEAADQINLISTKDASQLTDVSVYGQDGVDTITSNTAQMNRGRTQGGEGNDNINFGTAVSYSVYGGADNDTIVVTNANASTVQGSKGADNITANTLSGSKVYGGADNDTITVTTISSSIVQGSAGNDIINADGAVTGNSKINGGADNDTIRIGVNGAFSATKGDTINGNKGADAIFVSQGDTVDDVTIFGGSGSDNINLVDNQTTISGDLGSDIINGGVGDDVSISGGDGLDTIQISTGSALGAVNANANTAAIVAANADSAATSSVNGGDGIDTIQVAAGNTLAGGATAAASAIAKGSTTIMQGRTASAAATAVTANVLAGNAIAANDTLTFGNGVDVVTNFTRLAAVANGVSNDVIGAELTTTLTNLNFSGGTGATTFRDGAQVGLTWEQALAAGETTVLRGTWTGGATNTFAVVAAGTDMLVIQGDNSAMTANTSAMVLVDPDSATAANTAFNFADFGGATVANGGNATAFTTFIG